jgi:hypothetical protein
MSFLRKLFDGFMSAAVPTGDWRRKITPWEALACTLLLILVFLIAVLTAYCGRNDSGHRPEGSSKRPLRLIVFTPNLGLDRGSEALAKAYLAQNDTTG